MLEVVLEMFLVNTPALEEIQSQDLLTTPTVIKALIQVNISDQVML